MMEKGRIEFTDQSFLASELNQLPDYLTGGFWCPKCKRNFHGLDALRSGHRGCNLADWSIPSDEYRANEIEWLQSLLDHIEKGEIELVKESIGGAISILEAK